MHLSNISSAPYENAPGINSSEAVADVYFTSEYPTGNATYGLRGYVSMDSRWWDCASGGV